MGQTKRILWGYRLCDGIIVIDERIAPVIQMVFQKVDKGIAVNQICRDMEGMGLKNRLGNVRWQPRKIRDILKEEAYCGKDGYPVLLKLLQEKGVDLADHPALQVQEYIYDMAAVMRAADLVICRAGASTVSELTALGVPAIMVPSPYVTNNHQEKNARALETHGGVEVLLEQDSSGQALFQTAAGILRDDARREAMASAMAELGIRDAAQRIYETVQELL